jgi:hypothetical protein
VRNVETDLEAYRELIARGFRTVPVTLVGDDPAAVAVVGFDDTALRRAIGLPDSAR